LHVERFDVREVAGAVAKPTTAMRLSDRVTVGLIS